MKSESRISDPCTREGAPDQTQIVPGFATCRTLASAVRRYVRYRTRHPREAGVMPQGQILVVDDEPDTLQFMELLLRRWGFDVVTACNGKDALRLLSSLPAADLVVTDLSMPEMD